MKLFELKQDEETHWIAAKNEKEAVELEDLEWGTSFDKNEDYEIREIDESEFESIIIRNTDYDPDDEDMWETLPISELFSKDQKYSEIIASSEYD